MPLAVIKELLVREQHRAAVFVFARYLIVVQQFIQSLPEVDNLADIAYSHAYLRVPRTVFHAQQAALSAERHSLQLHEGGTGLSHDATHPLHVLHVVSLHQSEPKNRALRLRFTLSLQPHATLHRIHARAKTFPIIAEQRTVQFLESLLRSPIDRDVELGHRRDSPDLLRELGVRHKERRGAVSMHHSPPPPLLMQQVNELSDAGIHDRLAHKR